MCVRVTKEKERRRGGLGGGAGRGGETGRAARNEEEKCLLVNVARGVPASAVPFSSEAWRTELALGRVPLAWCLKMEEESSSRVQPSR